MSQEPKQMAGKAIAGTVGWRECVVLPDLPLGPIEAKIDTGAQTSALHASDIVEIDLDGKPGVQFRIYPDHRTPDNYIEVCAPLSDNRPVRSSSGVVTHRMVIRTRVDVAGQSVRTEVTLVDRARMRYPMLIGRTTLRKARLLVDPGRSWLHGRIDSQ